MKRNAKVMPIGEQTFVLRNLSALARMERIWRETRNEGSPTEEPAQCLGEAVQKLLHDLILTHYSIELKHLPMVKRIDFGSVLPGIGTFVGQEFDTSGIVFEAQGFHRGPQLAFDFREEWLFDGTMAAVIDLGPWRRSVGALSRAQAIFRKSEARFVLSDRKGPYWRYKVSEVPRTFWGFWVPPDDPQLTLDMSSLVGDDPKSAVRSVKGPVEQFVKFCKQLKSG